MSYFHNLPLFPPGDLRVTDSILSRGFSYIPLLRRHLAGDWGQIDPYMESENNDALAGGAEILSQYAASDAQSVEDLITIVTAADRSYTVIFLLTDPSA